MRRLDRRGGREDGSDGGWVGVYDEYFYYLVESQWYSHPALDRDSLVDVLHNDCPLVFCTVRLLVRNIFWNSRKPPTAITSNFPAHV